ncbi:hypothetical protein [Paraglaciecola mesophila]|nr:hypothetical protein [Paraglaciecola mesophila]
MSRFPGGKYSLFPKFADSVLTLALLTKLLAVERQTRVHDWQPNV